MFNLSLDEFNAILETCFGLDCGTKLPGDYIDYIEHGFDTTYVNIIGYNHINFVRSLRSAEEFKEKRRLLQEALDL